MLDNFNCLKAILLLALVSCSLTVVGCFENSSGDNLVSKVSFPSEGLNERVAFLEQYVTFRRNYLKLEYDVFFVEGGGGRVPSPSEWDIRFIAQVPAGEVKNWIPVNAKRVVEKRELPSWESALLKMFKTPATFEWYRVGQTEIGIDKARSIVAYRNFSN